MRIVMALEKAKFINNKDNNTIVVQFNPSSLTISANAIISEQKTQQLESDSTIINIGGIQSRQLSLTLVLDTYQDGQLFGISIGGKTKSVKNIVDGFEVFMNSSAEISFVWGKIMFTGFINNISAKYEMFTSDGTPVRATVDISMEESAYLEEDFFNYEWDEDMDVDGTDDEESIINKVLSKMSNM